MDGAYGVLEAKRFFGAMPRNARVRGEREFRNPRHLFVECDYYIGEENKENLIKSRNSCREVGKIKDVPRHHKALIEECREIHEADFPADYLVLKDVERGHAKASADTF